MNPKKPLNLLFGMAALCALPFGLSAQDTEVSPEEAEMMQDILQLNSFVVTSVARPDKTKLSSSVSVSNLPTEQMDVYAPRNTAEYFRSLPGIRIESTSGEGNANLTIRGIPLADGGSRYVQFHEDGLPVVEFGDMSFGTADQYFRPDMTLKTVESVRGGSAAIFASNSPGGVINMVSKTGEVDGGTLGLTYGLNYDNLRADFNYGSALTDTTRFNIGGFYRHGEGPRDTGTSDGGGQVKMNFTKELPIGHIRVYFKAIDDTAPTYLPAPAHVKDTNSFGNLPGFNVKTGSLFTSHLNHYQAVDSNGNLITKQSHGINSKVTSLGAELMLNPTEDFNIVNRTRVSSQSANWGAPFPATVRYAPAAVANYAGTFAGADHLVYGSGANAGARVADDQLVTTVHQFDTDVKSMDWVGNDLKVSKFFHLEDGSKIDLTVGYYLSEQEIEMDWAWSTFLLETAGRDANVLNLADATGNLLTTNGQLSYGPLDWGNFSRAYDLEYTVDAPVASFTFEKDNLTIDVGARYDNITARGLVVDGVAQSYDVNNDGVISGPEIGGVPTFNRANGTNVNYDLGYGSYSAGLNYKFNRDMAAFARYSFGGRAGADRLALNAGSSGPGFEKDSFYYDVTQGEVGLKYRNRDFASGQLTLNGTLFFAETREPSGAELNRVNPPLSYDSVGLELEGSYVRGSFSLIASGTFTDAEGTMNSGGNRISYDPRRQASFIYSVAPTYTWGNLTFGGSALGTTASYVQDPAHGTAQDANALKLPAYMTLNGFAAYRFTPDLTLSVNVNNLMDTLGWTEGEEGAMPGGALPIARLRTLPGRTASMSLTYSF